MLLLLLMLRRTHPPSHYRTMTMMMTALSYTDYTYCAVLGHMCSSGAWRMPSSFCTNEHTPPSVAPGHSYSSHTHTHSPIASCHVNVNVTASQCLDSIRSSFKGSSSSCSSATAAAAVAVAASALACRLSPLRLWLRL